MSSSDPSPSNAPADGPRVAIVGAGVAGLTCAHALQARGVPAVLFDKGRRPGGRLATRDAATGDYDHGAQYFTARDPRFERQVDAWAGQGRVAEWHGRIVSRDDAGIHPGRSGTRRWVGVPCMNAIAAAMAASCDVRSQVKVRSIERDDDGWTVEHEAGPDGGFDTMVIAVPAPQAAPFLTAVPMLQAQVAAVRMNGCWALLLTLAEPLGVAFDGMFVNAGPLSWIARNGSKPARTGETWVVHASPDWTAERLNVPRIDVIEPLTRAFEAAVGVRVPPILDRQAHLWRYAIPHEATAERCLGDDAARIVVCGDWCGGPRVEGAYLSGLAAADRVLAMRADR